MQTECFTCEGWGCPFCQEADYHTACDPCPDCHGSGVLNLGWRDEAAAGFIAGGVLGAFFGIFQ